MLSKIPCLFCFSKAPKSEEYPDDSVRFEAEEIYKLLCSLLHIKLKRSEDIFYLLWTTNAFLPLCKSCSILFRNFSELATSESTNVDQKVLDQKLKLLAEEIRVVVQNSEKDGSSKSGLEFAIGAVGPSKTGSAKQARDLLKGIQKFRQSVVQVKGKSPNSSKYVRATEKVQNVPVEVIKVKDKPKEPKEVETLNHVDKNNVRRSARSKEAGKSKDLVIVRLEKIIQIKSENNEDDTDVDDNSADKDWEDEGHDDTDTERSESENEDDSDSSEHVDPKLSEDIEDTNKNKRYPRRRQPVKIIKTRRSTLNKRKYPTRQKNVMADCNTITKSGGRKCGHCDVRFKFKINLLRHIDKYHTNVQILSYHKKKNVKKPGPKSKKSKREPVKWEYPDLPKNPKLIYSQDPKKPERFKCNKCNEDFATPSSVRRHAARFHSGKKPGKKSIAHRNKTNKPKKLDTDSEDENIVKKSFKCPQCPQTFTLEKNINKHILRLHSGQKKKKKRLSPKQIRVAWTQVDEPVECDHCNTMFSNQANLSRHIRRIKLGPRVLKKDPGDVKVKKKSKDVKCKNTWRPERRKRMCLVCKEEFLDPSNLNRHMITVHYKCGLFECSECKRTFSRRDGLKQHQNRFHSKSKVS